AAVGTDGEAEANVRRANGLTVVPTGARIELERDRHRVRRPAPLLCEPRRESTIPDDVQIVAHLSEMIKQKIDDLLRLQILHQWRKQYVGVRRIGDDQR